MGGLVDSAETLKLGRAAHPVAIAVDRRNDLLKVCLPQCFLGHSRWRTMTIRWSSGEHTLC